MENCEHPSKKAYRDIIESNVLRCGLCHIILTTKIGDEDYGN